ncbi:MULTISPECIES: gamma-glutamyltransferase family protein [Microbacterium]|uniref:gamma-glutamyltransferase family protein n=1 Tax=Microbacterium TaxID=33882 RepID=UPI000C2BA48A|nr:MULTISPECIES: gamma-glutamyltransferase family protein [Microbacterium]
MQFTTRPEIVGSFGAVASTHWLASSSGMAVLEEGGNAFDAAVAAGLVLHVVEPHLNGLGGDTPIMGFDVAGGEPWVLCGQGPAPAAATAAAYADLGLGAIPGTGHLAAVVPGSFGAWMSMLERHGTLSLERVTRFAIEYARHGYPLVPDATVAIASVASLLSEHWTTSAEIYLPGGTQPVPRARFRNPLLADTLERIVVNANADGGSREAVIARARDEFYRGFVADAIDAWMRQPVRDSTGSDHAGLLTGADMAEWEPTWERPTTIEFGGVTVAKTGPWGQGPVLLQQLAMLAHQDIGAPGSAQMIHAVTETAKLAFADREAFYGDPNFVDVPLDALLADDYARSRAQLVSEESSGELRPGSPGGHEPHLSRSIFDAPIDAAAGTGEPTLASMGVVRGDTCHLDVVDRWGNMVAATPSGGWLQSSPAIPGLGFSLPTRAQMFWLEQGLPNSIAPRKRPRTTLSPGMLLRDGAPYLAFGTPGGDQQDQWTVTFLLNLLSHGMNLQESIDAATWHSTHMPSSFFPRSFQPRGVVVEQTVGDAALDELRDRGHDVVVAPAWSLGRLSAAGFRDDGMVIAAANARGMQGYAVGR